MRRAGVWSALAFQRARAAAPPTEATRRASARSTSWPTSTRERAHRRRPRRATTTRRSASTRRAGRPMPARRAKAHAQRCRIVDRRPASRARPASLLIDAQARRERAARAALHLRHRLARLGDAQPRRQRARARGAADGGLARAVGVPQPGGRLDVQRAAARDRPRPSSATPSSPAGCRAASRCWSRARRAAKAAQAQLRGGPPRHARHRAAGAATRACSGAFQRWQDPAWKRETVSMR